MTPEEFERLMRMRAVMGGGSPSLMRGFSPRFDAPALPAISSGSGLGALPFDARSPGPDPILSRPAPQVFAPDPNLMAAGVAIAQASRERLRQRQQEEAYRQAAAAVAAANAPPPVTPAQFLRPLATYPRPQSNAGTQASDPAMMEAFRQYREQSPENQGTFLDPVVRAGGRAVESVKDQAGTAKKTALGAAAELRHPIRSLEGWDPDPVGALKKEARGVGEFVSEDLSKPQELVFSLIGELMYRTAKGEDPADVIRKLSVLGINTDGVADFVDRARRPGFDEAIVMAYEGGYQKPGQGARPEEGKFEDTPAGTRFGPGGRAAWEYMIGTTEALPRPLEWGIKGTTSFGLDPLNVPGKVGKLDDVVRGADNLGVLDRAYDIAKKPAQAANTVLDRLGGAPRQGAGALYEAGKKVPVLGRGLEYLGRTTPKQEFLDARDRVRADFAEYADRLGRRVRGASSATAQPAPQNVGTLSQAADTVLPTTFTPRPVEGTTPFPERGPVERTDVPAPEVSAPTEAPTTSPGRVVQTERPDGTPAWKIEGEGIPESLTKTAKGEERLFSTPEVPQKHLDRLSARVNPLLAGAKMDDELIGLAKDRAKQATTPPPTKQAAQQAPKDRWVGEPTKKGEAQSLWFAAKQAKSRDEALAVFENYAESKAGLNLGPRSDNGKLVNGEWRWDNTSRGRQWKKVSEEAEVFLREWDRRNPDVLGKLAGPAGGAPTPPQVLLDAEPRTLSFEDTFSSGKFGKGKAREAEDAAAQARDKYLRGSLDETSDDVRERLSQAISHRHTRLTAKEAKKGVTKPNTVADVFRKELDEAEDFAKEAHRVIRESGVTLKDWLNKPETWLHGQEGVARNQIDVSGFRRKARAWEKYLDEGADFSDPGVPTELAIRRASDDVARIQTKYVEPQYGRGRRLVVGALTLPAKLARASLYDPLNFAYTLRNYISDEMNWNIAGGKGLSSAVGGVYEPVKDAQGKLIETAENLKGITQSPQELKKNLGRAIFKAQRMVDDHVAPVALERLGMGRKGVALVEQEGGLGGSVARNNWSWLEQKLGFKATADRNQALEKVRRYGGFVEVLSDNLAQRYADEFLPQMQRAGITDVEDYRTWLDDRLPTFFHPDEVRDLTRQYMTEKGIQRGIEGVAEQARRTWTNIARKSADEAAEFIKRPFVVTTENHFDRLYGGVSAFHRWSSRAYPFYLEEAIRHPGLVNAWSNARSHLEKESQGQKDNVLGLLYAMSTPAGLAVFLDPGAFSLVQQLWNMNDFAEPQNLSRLGELRRSLRTAGIGVWPVIDALVNATGAYGDEYVQGPYSSKSTRLFEEILNVAEAYTGRDLNRPLVEQFIMNRREEISGSGAIPGVNEVMAGDATGYEKDRVASRIATNNPEAVADGTIDELIADMDGPEYGKAKRQLAKEGALITGYNAVSPFTARAVDTGRELIMRGAKADDPEAQALRNLTLAEPGPAMEMEAADLAMAQRVGERGAQGEGDYYDILNPHEPWIGGDTKTLPSGETINRQDLAALSYEDREKIATWFLQSSGQLRNVEERMAVREETKGPADQTFEAWRDANVPGDPDYLEPWRNQMAAQNEDFARELESHKSYLREQGIEEGSLEWNEHLDIWTKGPAPYYILNGIKSSVYERTPRGGVTGTGAVTGSTSVTTPQGSAPPSSAGTTSAPSASPISETGSGLNPYRDRIMGAVAGFNRTPQPQVSRPLGPNPFSEVIQGMRDRAAGYANPTPLPGSPGYLTADKRWIPGQSAPGTSGLTPGGAAANVLPISSGGTGSNLSSPAALRTEAAVYRNQMDQVNSFVSQMFNGGEPIDINAPGLSPYVKTAAKAAAAESGIYVPDPSPQLTAFWDWRSWAISQGNPNPSEEDYFAWLVQAGAR
jgi:hypothetical protein